MSLGAIAQSNDDLGNWIMYFGANKIGEKTSIHTEIQYRNHTTVPNNIEQLLLRTGLNYHISKKAMATAGYAYIGSYIYDSEPTGPEFKENRIWQQFILRNTVGRVGFEHRYRTEQRWVNGEFSHRLRYRIMVTVPLNNKEITPGTFFLGFYDEIFMNTEQVFFDRNRLYAAVGYQVNPITQVQVGALHQGVNGFGKYNLQFALLFNPDLRKKDQE